MNWGMAASCGTWQTRVLTAETFGLLSSIFFVATLVYAFKYPGRARVAVGSDTGKAWFLWLMGAALLANMEFEEAWPDFELGLRPREGVAGAFSLYGE